MLHLLIRNGLDYFSLFLNLVHCIQCSWWLNFCFLLQPQKKWRGKVMKGERVPTESSEYEASDDERMKRRGVSGGLGRGKVMKGEEEGELQLSITRLSNSFLFPSFFLVSLFFIIIWHIIIIIVYYCCDSCQNYNYENKDDVGILISEWMSKLSIWKS